MGNTCGNCFRETLTGQGICTACGFDSGANREKYPLALAPGSILNGRYIIGRVLGQGGFGITYTAKDHQTGQIMAIKEFFPDSMATRTSHTTVTPLTGEKGENFAYGKNTFLNEAKTMAEFIGNPNIVRVYSYFEENGTGYFVMEYVDGRSFQDILKENFGRVSWEEALKILLPVMDALSAVHEKGIIHRDIAPDNICIAKDGTVKLLDFGAARYSLGNVSQSLDVVLRHGFAPKEQYKRHGRQGPYTDIYALGATLYYAITGSRPDDAIERLDEDTLPLPSTLGANVEPWQEDVILKAMAIQPEDRYQSVKDFKVVLTAPPRQEEKADKKESREKTVRKKAEKKQENRKIVIEIPVKKDQNAAKPVRDIWNDLKSYAIIKKIVDKAKGIPAFFRVLRAEHKWIWRVMVVFAVCLLILGGIFYAECGTRYKLSLFARRTGDWRENVLMQVKNENWLTEEKLLIDTNDQLFDTRFIDEDIVSVTFLDDLDDMPLFCYDVSHEKNGTVWAWFESNGMTNDGMMYDLYIAADGGINAREAVKEGTFNCWYNLERVDFGGNFHTDEAETLDRMFNNCEKLESVDFAGFQTSKVKNMRCMFSSCESLREVDLSSLDTSSVTDMRDLFAGCKSLTELDLSNFDTSSVTSMGKWNDGMFGGCGSLTRLDLSSFDTSGVKSMEKMFNGCTSLTELDLSHFDTFNVENMKGMFIYCSALAELDISGFDSSSVEDMESMFYYCRSLEELICNDRAILREYDKR